MGGSQEASGQAAEREGLGAQLGGGVRFADLRGREAGEVRAEPVFQGGVGGGPRPIKVVFGAHGAVERDGVTVAFGLSVPDDGTVALAPGDPDKGPRDAPDGEAEVP